MIALILTENAFEQDIRELLMAFFPGHAFVHTEAEADGASLICRGGREKENFVLALTFPEHAADLGLHPEAYAGEFPREALGKTFSMTCIPDFSVRKAAKNEIKRALYRLCHEITGRELPWGTLTGIRPTKIALTGLLMGETEDTIRRDMKETYYTSDEKIALCLDVAGREKRMLAGLDVRHGWSLYVGIPFCPTTCLYCSFTSFPIGAWKDRLDDYFDAMFREMDYVADRVGGGMSGHGPSTIYIGGGTPTSLDPEHLDRLLSKIRATFAMDRLREFTVEAGRPDSITEEKLTVLRKHGISRISINPQTMKQATLDLIGRRHTVTEVIEKYRLARELGFDNINMDIICGLPEETEDDVRETLRKIRELKPDSLTVHSLAIKRAARLNIQRERYRNVRIVNTQGMIDMTARAAREMGLNPYYLYRQKNMAGNFENTGYAAPGKECLYNVLIMEERQTILACGAGTTSKFVFPGENRIERAENCKDVATYITNLDEMIARKERYMGKFPGE
jgi:coproporphyrinogen dehydrogenase HemZ